MCCCHKLYSSNWTPAYLKWGTKDDFLVDHWMEKLSSSYSSPKKPLTDVDIILLNLFFSWAVLWLWYCLVICPLFLIFGINLHSIQQPCKCFILSHYSTLRCKGGKESKAEQSTFKMCSCAHTEYVLTTPAASLRGWYLDSYAMEASIKDSYIYPWEWTLDWIRSAWNYLRGISNVNFSVAPNRSFSETKQFHPWAMWEDTLLYCYTGCCAILKHIGITTGD